LRVIGRGKAEVPFFIFGVPSSGPSLRNLRRRRARRRQKFVSHLDDCMENEMCSRKKR